MLSWRIVTTLPAGREKRFPSAVTRVNPDAQEHEVCAIFDAQEHEACAIFDTHAIDMLDVLQVSRPCLS